MTISQEEALYEFLDNAAGMFELSEAVSFVRKSGSGRVSRLAPEIEDFINFRNLAFPAGTQRWVSRRACFEPLTFVISPTRLELVNGILIPGHRCVPFANTSLLPQEYSFCWQGSPIPFTTTEGPPDEFYPYYSIFGEEYAPQYVARDNSENEEAFNSDPYEDPPEVSIKTLDMRNIYRETAFVPGDRFTVRTLDWKEGRFELAKAGKEEWGKEELLAWQEAAENGFEASFGNLGPGTCTEEQIAYAYWYGGSRMREVPAYALEDFLYEKTDRIETTAYGIESRFWYAGREIPDRKELDGGNTRPDKTPVEDILHRLNIPVSEYVIQSYIRDSLFRGENDVNRIMERLVPGGTYVVNRDWKILFGYIENILKEFGELYSSFSDKAMGPVRQRVGELHTAVVDLAARLRKGDKGSIDPSWLPRHTFIILSQIQNQAAGMLEDLDSDEGAGEAELDAMDSSLDSMIETYEEMKELINEALDSFRRNKLTLIRAGGNSETVTERLLQLSIGGIDVWRRILVPESCTLGDLHNIIQIVFGWQNSQNFQFITERETPSAPLSFPEIPEKNLRCAEKAPFEKKYARDGSPETGLFEKGMELHTAISDLADRNTPELLYEYGTKWNVRIMILSRHDSPGKRPVRCVAGAGAAPPEFIGGPLRFRKVISALEGGNDMERLGARRELGLDFVAGDFNIDACNRQLGAGFPPRGRGPDG